MNYQYVQVCTCLYLYVQILNDDWPLQHAHIENIKSVANLSNNKDVFMCILRFHARAGYLQHYEALLKELNDPALLKKLNDQVPDDAAPQDEPRNRWYILVYTETSKHIMVCTITYLYILI